MGFGSFDPGGEGVQSFDDRQVRLFVAVEAGGRLHEQLERIAVGCHGAVQHPLQQVDHGGDEGAPGRHVRRQRLPKQPQRFLRRAAAPGPR